MALTHAQGDKTESAPVVTPLPTVITAGSIPASTPIFTTQPAAPPIDTAVASAIGSAPSLIVFGVLVGLIIYLIRDRKEITALLANFVPQDMAVSIVDTAIKGVISAMDAVARTTAGDGDDKGVDFFAKQAGYTRVIDAKGGISWQKQPGEDSAAAQRPYAGMERITLPDGTNAYKAGAGTGIPRNFNADGTWTRTDSFTLDSSKLDSGATAG